MMLMQSVPFITHTDDSTHAEMEELAEQKEEE